MMRALPLLALALLVAACAVAPPPEAPAKPTATRGLIVEPYRGALAEYPPVAEAAEKLPETVRASLELVQLRLGLALDRDRRRRVRLADDPATPVLRTKIEAGRAVQIVSICAEPIAQGRVDAGEAVTDAVARAVLDDAPRGTLPVWFESGAPLWLSGAWDRRLHERALRRLPEDPDRVISPFESDATVNDPLTGAFFLRFVAEEFGAKRVAALGRALAVAATPAEGLSAALETDPASLPVAFDGYRLRVVGDLLEDEYVAALREARGRPPDERITALSGLARGAPDRYVAAAILSELAAAQFDTGDWAAAAETIGRIEREYSRYAVRPDRDRYLFALCFARQGRDRAAEIRLRTFLAEFPTSLYAPPARYELGTLLLRTDRPEEGIGCLRDLIRRHPRDPVSRRARAEVGRYEISRHRYGLARNLVEPALPDPEAERVFAEVLIAETEGPDPDTARFVEEAIRDLASPTKATGRGAVRVLEEVGPVARPVLEAEFRGGAGTRTQRLRALEVLAGWPDDAAMGVLVGYLECPTADVIRAAVEAMLARGVPADRIRAEAERVPGDPHHAREAVAEVLLARPVLPEVAPLLRSGAFADRARAAAILGPRPEPEALNALLRLARDPSPQVRRAAAAALGPREEPAATATLDDLLGDASPLVRGAAVDSLARAGEWATVRARGLADESAMVRLSAFLALRERGDPADGPALVALLEDPVPAVRLSVKAWLEQAPFPWTGPALATALRAADSHGRATRLVRVMSGLSGSDFGYDPTGDEAEHDRVAEAFLAWWRSRPGGR